MLIRYEMNKTIKHPMIWILFAFFAIINIITIEIEINDVKNDMKLTHQYILADRIDKDYIDSVVSIYENLDMVSILNTKLEMTDYNPEGSYRKFINSNYKKMSERVKEIKESGESKEVTYPGQVYRLHNLIYGKLLKQLIIEMGIIISIMTMFLMDYERINNTIPIVYSSRVGRNIQKTKIISSIVAAGIINALLLTITYGYFFGNVSYKGLWGESISSAMAMEPRGILMYPFITYFKMSFGFYFICSIIYAFLITCIISGVCAAVQLIIENSYISIIIVIIIMLGLLNILQFSTNSWFDIVLYTNIMAVWVDCGAWFMENNVATSFEWFELFRIMIQIVFVSILLWFSSRILQKRDY